MSIYATIRLARVAGVELFVQGVPAHIDYEGPEWDFLGPPVAERDGAFRTIFVVDADIHKTGQRYDEWLLQLSEAEYYAVPWEHLRARLKKILTKRKVRV